MAVTVTQDAVKATKIKQEIENTNGDEDTRVIGFTISGEEEEDDYYEDDE